MKNNAFEIDGLGKFEHVANLKVIDFPRTFVCKRINKKNDISLFIFDEYENKNDYVMWACCPITFCEFDRLNQGTQTIEECFTGPFGSDKEGFLIKNISGDAQPSVIHVAVMPEKVRTGTTYSESFVEECHGAGPLSLVYGKKIASFVLDNKKYNNPMFANSILSNNASKIKSMFSSLPYSIATRNSLISLSNAHSLVLNVIVSSRDEDDDELDLDVKNESDEVFDALNTILSLDSTEADVINAFRSKTDAIDKFESFINSFDGEILDNKPLIQLVDSKKMDVKIIPINKELKTGIIKKNKDCANRLKESEKQITYHDVCGSFLMYDNTGKRAFKFRSDIQNTIFKGFCVFDEDSLEKGITIKKKKYNIKIKTTVFQGDFGTSKPQYEIVSVAEAKIPSEYLLKI